MSETYHPYFESTSEKEDDKKKDKKDQKKRAAPAELHLPKATEHASRERPLKLGGKLLRPLTIEQPKQSGVESETKQKEGAPGPRAEAAPVAHEAQAAMPDEVRHAYDEQVADEGDKKTEKPKEQTTEAKPGGADATEPVERAQEKDEPGDTEAAFQEIVQGPELADLADLKLPEVPAVAEPVGAAPHQEAVAADPEAPADEEAHNVPAEPPDNPSVEAASGELPSSSVEGAEEPPASSSAEGASWDDEPWEQPAGGLGAPATREALNAVDDRRELDDLYHTSRERGLTAAVGIIGLGLILEHFAAKRRDKRLKRQLDVQNRQLGKTNQALQLEQRLNQSTQRKLEHVHTAQTATKEQLETVTTTSIEKSAEIAAAGSVIGRAAERGRAKITPAQEKVLAERLKHSRELGRAMRQNPELKDVYDLKQSLELAATTANQQEQQIDGLKREVGYEYLRRKQVDTDRSPKVGGSGSVGASGMPILPSPQQQLPAGLQADYLLGEHASADKKGKLSANPVIPVAAATILVILAAVLIMVFALR